MAFIKKWFKLLSQLFKMPKAVVSFFVILLLIVFLFILPYSLILINALAIFNSHAFIVVLLIILLPLVVQIAIGLLFKSFYEILDYQEAELSKKQFFLGGLFFFPTLILAIAISIILFIV